MGQHISILLCLHVWYVNESCNLHFNDLWITTSPFTITPPVCLSVCVRTHMVFLRKYHQSKFKMYSFKISPTDKITHESCSCVYTLVLSCVSHAMKVWFFSTQEHTVGDFFLLRIKNAQNWHWFVFLFATLEKVSIMICYMMMQLQPW